MLSLWGVTYYNILFKLNDRNVIDILDIHELTARQINCGSLIKKRRDFYVIWWKRNGA